MDYEKKYKEALERAKSFELPEYKNIMASVFPELAESEDEKIREKLIGYFSSVKGFSSLEYNYGITGEDAVAWLEKQGAENPIKE